MMAAKLGQILIGKTITLLPRKVKTLLGRSGQTVWLRNLQFRKDKVLKNEKSS
jgi:hypothetical protein